MTDQNQSSTKKIVGIGSALIDVLCKVSDEFLAGISDIKGGMTLVDSAFVDQAVEKLPEKPSIVSGGAACNTLLGIGRLGGNAAFVGQRGEDDYGELFESGLMKNNVTPNLFTSKTPTGRVLSLITPDAQRSMFTYLGASAEMTPESITKDCFDKASLVMVEGYLLFNRELMAATLKAAKEAGAGIALDLASFTVVEESRNFLKDHVLQDIDILIANEDEARAFTGKADEVISLEILSSYADIAVLKVGERGSYIAHNGQVHMVEAMSGKDIVDTTGAGDLWAAGFLYGLSQGYSISQCGALASACGFEVCQVIGAAIPDEGWQRIKSYMAEMG